MRTLPIALLCLAPTLAQGAFVYTIATPNSAIDAYTGPYATATVNLTDATHASVSFDSLTNGGNIYLMGDGGTVAVNVHAASWDIANLAWTGLSGFSEPTLSNAGAGNEDGFGSFNQKVDSFDGFSHAATQISFTLTNNSGIWRSAGDVLTPNAVGYSAAIHAYVCAAATCNPSSGALATGFAVDNSTDTPSSAPLPLTWALLLSGLGLLSAGTRRHRQRKPSSRPSGGAAATASSS